MLFRSQTKQSNAQPVVEQTVEIQARKQCAGGADASTKPKNFNYTQDTNTKQPLLLSFFGCEWGDDLQPDLTNVPQNIIVE